MTRTTRSPAYRFEGNRSGNQWEATLLAVWEASLDPISDDYTPREISASSLFSRWASQVREKHPDLLIPIHWFVDTEGESLHSLDLMPFQLDHSPRFKKRDFLSVYTWPRDASTGEPLNWLSLPVADKLWRRGRADKGGFIQEATGWKPSILQPYVYLPSLEKAVYG